MKSNETVGEKMAGKDLDMEMVAYYERLFFEIFNHVFDPGDVVRVREMRSLGYDVNLCPKSARDHTKPVSRAGAHKEPDRMEMLDNTLCDYLNELGRSGKAEELEQIQDKLYAEMAEEILTLHKTVLAIRACERSGYNRQ